MSEKLVLDQTSQGLVNLAIAEYQRTVSEAERVAQSVLNDRLTPVRDKYGVGGKLELDQNADGEWFAADTTPKLPQATIKAKRSRRK